MQKIAITQTMIDNATKRADDLGVLNRSFMEGKGNYVGFLGEEILVSLLTDCEYVSGYDYDLTYQGHKIEVKTKKTSAVPKPEYLCSVSANNLFQKTDYYAFCRVNPVENVGWVCGFIPKDEFMAKSRFMKKGDPDGFNGYRVQCDCRSIKIEDIYKYDQFLEMIKQCQTT